jgi:hypothetical protein
MLIVHLNVGPTEFRHMLGFPNLIHFWVILHYRLDPFPPYKVKIGLLNDLFLIVQVPGDLISPMFF